MKRALGLILLFLAAYLAFLVATFPAGWAYALAKPHLQRAGVGLYELQGSIWSGRAAVVQVQGRRLPPVAWRLHPADLLTGRLGAWVDLGDGRVQGELALAPGPRVQVQDLRLAWDMPDLLPRLDLAALQLGGRLEGRLDALLIAQGLPREARGRLSWKAASAALPKPVALGDLHLDLDSDEAGIHGRFSDGGGPLGLNGTLDLDGQGAWRLRLTLIPREGRRSALGGLLAMLGRADGQGRVTLQRSGRLQPLAWP